MTTVDWPPEGGGSSYNPTGGPSEFVSSSAGAADAGKGVLLDGSGQLDTSLLPACVVGAMDYKGNWDASGGGTPASTDNGAYYRVSVAGTIDPGARPVQEGDFVVYNGTTSQYDIINAVQLSSEVTNDSLFPGTYLDEALNVEAKNDLVRGWNTTGILLNTGLVVKVTGSSSQASPEDAQPEIGAITAVTDTPLGVTWESIADASGGFITRTGMLEAVIDTSGGAVGDPVYFDAGGALTLTATGSVVVGIVASVGNPGDVMIVVPSEDTDVVPNRSDVPGDYTTAALNELNRLTSHDDAQIYRTTVASEAEMNAAVAALEAGDYSLGVFEITGSFVLSGVSYSLTRDLIVHGKRDGGDRPVLTCKFGVDFAVANRCRIRWEGVEFAMGNGSGPTLLNLSVATGTNVAYGSFIDCKFDFSGAKNDTAIITAQYDNTVFAEFVGCQSVRGALATQSFISMEWNATVIADFRSCDLDSKIVQMGRSNENVVCAFTACRVRSGYMGVVGFDHFCRPSMNVTFRFDAASVVDRTIDSLSGGITGVLDIYDNATTVPVGPSADDAYLVKGSTYQTGNQLDGKDVENNDVMYYDGAAWQVIKPFVHEGIDAPIHPYVAEVSDQEEFRDAIIEMEENDSYKSGLFLIDGSFTLNGRVGGASNFGSLKTTKAMRWAGEIGESATWPVLTFSVGSGVRWDDFGDRDFSFEIENLNMVFQSNAPHFLFTGDETGRYARKIRCENVDFDVNSNNPVFLVRHDTSALIEFVNCSGSSGTWDGFLVQAAQVGAAHELTGVSVHFAGCDFTSRLVSLSDDDDDVYARVSVSASRLLATAHSGNDGIWEYYDAGAPSFFEVRFGADSQIYHGYIGLEPTFTMTSAGAVYRETVTSGNELQRAIRNANDYGYSSAVITVDGSGGTLSIGAGQDATVRIPVTIQGANGAGTDFISYGNSAEYSMGSPLLAGVYPGLHFVDVRISHTSGSPIVVTGASKVTRVDFTRCTLSSVNELVMSSYDAAVLSRIVECTISGAGDGVFLLDVPNPAASGDGCLTLEVITSIITGAFVHCRRTSADVKVISSSIQPSGGVNPWRVSTDNNPARQKFVGLNVYYDRNSRVSKEVSGASPFSARFMEGSSSRLLTDVEVGVDDTIDNAAAVDKGGTPNRVGIPITAHPFSAGDIVTIAGTTSYDGTFRIMSETTDEIVITSAYTAETFGGSETVTLDTYTVEKFITDYGSRAIERNGAIIDYCVKDGTTPSNIRTGTLLCAFTMDGTDKSIGDSNVAVGTVPVTFSLNWVEESDESRWELWATVIGTDTWIIDTKVRELGDA